MKSCNSLVSPANISNRYAIAPDTSVVMTLHINGYNNPLSNAEAVFKGCVAGARSHPTCGSAMDPEAEWRFIAAGVSQTVSDDTRLHARSAAERLHGFWFVGAMQ